MKILLGSKSNLKISSVEKALDFIRDKGLYAKEISFDYQVVNSGVPDTPNSSETYTGAKQRALQLINNVEGLSMGLESGLIIREGKIFEECWCVIFDKHKSEWAGVSSAILLPEEVTTNMKEGKSHIDILNEIAKRKGYSPKDTWGTYTDGALPRQQSLYEASRNALVSYFTSL